MTTFLSNLKNYAEDTSHAFLGESRDGPYRPENSDFQRTIAHGAGYVFSPLRYAMEKTSDAIVKWTGGRSVSRGTHVQPTHKSETMPNKQSKRIEKKVEKKLVKRFKKNIPRRGGRGRGVPQMIRNTVSYRRGKPKSSVRFMRTGSLRSIRPPVAFGTAGKASTGFRFTGGRRPGCMRIYGKMYIGDIYAFGDNEGLNCACIAMNGDTTRSTDNILQGIVYVMPQNSFYTQPVIATMSQMFERYQMYTRLEYRPTVNTGTNGNVKFAYYNDPKAFIAQTNKNANLSTGPPNFYPVVSDFPSTADISANQTEHQASVYLKFTTAWATIPPKEDMKYVAASTYNTWLVASAIDEADMRYPVQGAWVVSCNGTGVAGNSFLHLGEIWMDFKLELCDMLSAQVSHSVTFTTMRKEHSHAGKSGERLSDLEKKVEDFLRQRSESKERSDGKRSLSQPR